ncbi:DOPA 4,5-dioxygenase family protein [Xylophilus sp.]|uniref:DOPA 4,5-dioxygenase family protein n=1 Tax=Xylophilus sp. TaxID=2653893 RepID=UPI0013B5FC3C|nr:DOPA 4,5-dioxygenase family protein [Xylophilus sp.]KAF1043252.1 MAG: hypothetical protein GAK38_04051 [Xylophilus sp.]
MPDTSASAPGTVPRPRNIFDRYHAHVYFGPDTVGQARVLCEEAGRRFGVAVGRVHERRVGPHPHWSCQLAFDRTQFEALVPWLDAQRGGLDVLVHGLSNDPLADHTDHASWLGWPSTLDLSVFGR